MLVEVNALAVAGKSGTHMGLQQLLVRCYQRLLEAASAVVFDRRGCSRYIDFHLPASFSVGSPVGHAAVAQMTSILFETLVDLEGC